MKHPTSPLSKGKLESRGDQPRSFRNSKGKDVRILCMISGSLYVFRMEVPVHINNSVNET